MSIKLGLCVTGSFCTFEKILILAQQLVSQDYIVTPILSYNAAQMDTKFFKAKEFSDKLEHICGVAPLTTIQSAEPVGTKKLFDICLVAPTTGNTLAKINNGITDTPVTMCVKAHLRNNRPVLLFVSTNDGLSASANNIGGLLNKKHIYFVPFSQDNASQKPNSLVANFDLVIPAICEALEERQLQPLLC